MELLLLVLILLFSATSAVPENVYGRKGSFYVFVCPLREDETGNVFWNFINKTGTIIPVSYGEIIYTIHPAHNRIDIVGDRSTGEYNLNMSGLQEADEGTYICGVSIHQPKEFYLELLVSAPTTTYAPTSGEYSFRVVLTLNFNVNIDLTNTNHPDYIALYDQVLNQLTAYYDSQPSLQGIFVKIVLYTLDKGSLIAPHDVVTNQSNSGPNVLVATNNIVNGGGTITLEGHTSGASSAQVTSNGKTSAPQTPGHFSVTDFGVSSISFEWDPGFNGGHEQTFYIEYRVTGLTSWTAKAIPNTQQTSRQTYTLSGLSGDTSYELRLYAENKLNKSLPTDIESVLTIKDTESSPGATIGGVAGGVVAVIVAVVVVLYIIKRRKGLVNGKKNVESKKTDDVMYQNQLNSDIYEQIDEAMNDGTDNPQPNAEDDSTEKTYEALGMKDNPNFYAELSSQGEQGRYYNTAEQYESLGAQDKPSVYEDLHKKRE